jgi:hypothetical protein
MDSGEATYQELWYPVGADFAWTYVNFTSQGSAGDTSTIVVQVDSLVGTTHHLVMCWLDGGGLCPFDEVVSNTGVERTLFGASLNVYEFPLDPGHQWITSQGEAPGSGGQPESLLTMSEVIGTEALELRTGWIFSDAIRVDRYVVRWPVNGGARDTTLASSDFLAPNVGRVSTMHWSGPQAGVSHELLRFSESPSMARTPR